MPQDRINSHINRCFVDPERQNLEVLNAVLKSRCDAATGRKRGRNPHCVAVVMGGNSPRPKGQREGIGRGSKNLDIAEMLGHPSGKFI